MKTTKASRDYMRRQITEADAAGNTVTLPSGGGILTEVMDDLENLNEAALTTVALLRALLVLEIR